MENTLAYLLPTGKRGVYIYTNQVSSPFIYIQIRSARVLEMPHSQSACLRRCRTAAHVEHFLLPPDKGLLRSFFSSERIRRRRASRPSLPRSWRGAKYNIINIILRRLGLRNMSCSTTKLFSVMPLARAGTNSRKAFFPSMEAGGSLFPAQWIVGTFLKVHTRPRLAYALRCRGY